MAGLSQSVKMVPVDATDLESVGYIIATRQLYVKVRQGGGTLCFEKVPGFRYQGLINAPRKDAYYRTFIKHSFLATPVTTPLG